MFINLFYYNIGLRVLLHSVSSILNYWVIEKSEFSFYSMETISFIKITKTADESSVYAIIDDFFLLFDWGYTMDGKLLVVLRSMPKSHKMDQDTKFWKSVVHKTLTSHHVIIFSLGSGKRIGS